MGRSDCAGAHAVVWEFEGTQQRTHDRGDYDSAAEGSAGQGQSLVGGKGEREEKDCVGRVMNGKGWQLEILA